MTPTSPLDHCPGISMAKNNIGNIAEQMFKQIAGLQMQPDGADQLEIAFEMFRTLLSCCWPRSILGRLFNHFINILGKLWVHWAVWECFPTVLGLRISVWRTGIPDAKRSAGAPVRLHDTPTRLPMLP